MRSATWEEVTGAWLLGLIGVRLPSDVFCRFLSGQPLPNYSLGSLAPRWGWSLTPSPNWSNAFSFAPGIWIPVHAGVCLLVDTGVCLLVNIGVCRTPLHVYTYIYIYIYRYKNWSLSPCKYWCLTTEWFRVKGSNRTGPVPNQTLFQNLITSVMWHSGVWLPVGIGASLPKVETYLL